MPGIGRFVRQLVHAVVANDQTDSFLLLHANPNPGRVPHYPSGSNVSRRVLRVNERWTNIIWHRLQVPIPADWLTGPIDLFHSPDFVMPPVRAARSILTVHDLAFLLYPEVRRRPPARLPGEDGAALGARARTTWWPTPRTPATT